MLSFGGRWMGETVCRITGGDLDRIPGAAYDNVHVVALFDGRIAVWYNYQHKALKGLSTAMAAGLSDTLWLAIDLAEMVDAIQPKPAKRGSLQKGGVT